MNMSKPRVLPVALASVALASCLLGSIAVAQDASSFSMDSDCTACHKAESADASKTQTDQEDSDAAETADTVDSADGKPSDAAPNSTDASPVASLLPLAVAHPQLTCIDCHSNEAKLEKAHAKATPESKMPTRLKRTKADAEICSTCHTSDALIEATASYEGIVDEMGTIVNPHDLPANESHDSTLCFDCHTSHEQGDVQTEAMTYCTSCHHEQVFACHTCHD